jgi:hypothetical protein
MHLLYPAIGFVSADGAGYKLTSVSAEAAAN